MQNSRNLSIVTLDSITDEYIWLCPQMLMKLFSFLEYGGRFVDKGIISLSPPDDVHNSKTAYFQLTVPAGNQVFVVKNLKLKTTIDDNIRTYHLEATRPSLRVCAVFCFFYLYFYL